MNLRQEAASLVGEWSGHNRLWLGPSEPARESDTSLQVTTAANGQFLVLTYAWSHEGEPHDGVLMVRLGHEPGPADMVWVDSFHTMGTFMQFSGRPATDGDVEGFTTWSPGSGPDWGWRIALSSRGAHELTVRMFISTPEGEEAPAVESRYERIG